MSNHLDGWGDTEMVGKGDHTLHLRESWWAIVGLTGGMRKVAQVNNCANGDKNRIVRDRVSKSEGVQLGLVDKNKRAGWGLVRVCVGTVLFHCILLCLALGQMLAMVCFLLLLVASLLQWLISPLLLLSLRMLLLWLLLLLELGVSRLALGHANFVCMVTLLFLSWLVLLPSNEHICLISVRMERGSSAFFFSLPFVKEGVCLVDVLMLSIWVKMSMYHGNFTSTRRDWKVKQTSAL